MGLPLLGDLLSCVTLTCVGGGLTLSTHLCNGVSQLHAIMLMGGVKKLRAYSIYAPLFL